jgi:hypothetical protein
MIAWKDDHCRRGIAIGDVRKRQENTRRGGRGKISFINPRTATMGQLSFRGTSTVSILRRDPAHRRLSRLSSKNIDMGRTVARVLRFKLSTIFILEIKKNRRSAGPTGCDNCYHGNQL